MVDIFDLESVRAEITPLAAKVWPIVRVRTSTGGQ